MLFEAVSAVTVKLNAVPAVAVAGAEIEKWVAGGIVTVIVFDVPVIEEFTVSVPVTVWPPAVLSVAEKVPTPLVSVELTGREADPSVVVKWTVPA